MDFEILGEITHIEPIARGTGVRARVRLNKFYGQGRWRKLKGVAQVRLLDGTIRLAEIHWYEAHGNRPEGIQTQTSFSWMILQ